MSLDREIYFHSDTTNGLVAGLQQFQRGISTDSVNHEMIYNYAADFYKTAVQEFYDTSLGQWVKLDNVFGNLDAKEITSTLLKDSFVTAGITLGEAGELSLTGFTKTSIVGALNELRLDLDNVVGGSKWSNVTIGLVDAVEPTSRDYINTKLGLLDNDVIVPVRLGSGGNPTLHADFTDKSILGALNQLQSSIGITSVGDEGSVQVSNGSSGFNGDLGLKHIVGSGLLELSLLDTIISVSSTSSGSIVIDSTVEANSISIINGVGTGDAQIGYNSDLNGDIRFGILGGTGKAYYNDVWIRADGAGNKFLNDAGQYITVSGGGSGGTFNFDYKFSTSTSPTTGNGKIQYNNADPTLVTEVYADNETDASVNVHSLLLLFLAGDTIYVFNATDSNLVHKYEITSTTDIGAGASVTYGVTYEGSTTGLWSNNENINFTLVESNSVVLPGSDKYVLFNDGSDLGAHVGFQYDKVVGSILITDQLGTGSFNTGQYELAGYSSVTSYTDASVVNYADSGFAKIELNASFGGNADELNLELDPEFNSASIYLVSADNNDLHIDVSNNLQEVIIENTRPDHLVITGWKNPPTMSINADPTKFDITTGVGYFQDKTGIHGNLTEYTYAGVTAHVANLGLTGREVHIYLSKTGVISQQADFTTGDLIDQVYLGNFTKNGGNTQLDFVTNQMPMYHSMEETFRTFMFGAIGGVQLINMVHTGVAATLQVNRSSGEVMRIGANSLTDLSQPDTLVIPSENPVTAIAVRYVDENGVINFHANGNVLDPTDYYDKGTTSIVAVNSNRYTLQRQYFFPSVPNETNMSLLGHTSFNSLAEAKSAAGTVEEDFSKSKTLNSAVFLGWWIIKGNATDTTNASTSEFLPFTGAFEVSGTVSGGGGGGGSSDFVGLTDTFNSYSGLAGGICTVNDAENGIEARFLIDVLLDEDWESGSFATNGWTTVNNGTNNWILSNVDPLPISGNSYSAYISNTGTTNVYNVNVAQVSHMYIDIVVPDDIDDLHILFDWLCQAEDGAGANDFDFGRLFFTDTGTTPVAGTLPTTGYTQIGRPKYNDSPLTEHEEYEFTPAQLSVVIGTTIRLVFTWFNDAAVGSNPPWNVDNIKLIGTRQVGGLNENIIADVEVKRDSNQTWNTTTDTPVSYNNLIRDVKGNWNGTDTFTINETGYYAIDANTEVILNQSGQHDHRIEFDGGPRTNEQSLFLPSAATYSTQTNFVGKLIKGTTIQIVNYQTSGFAGTIKGGEVTRFRMIGRRR